MRSLFAFSILTLFVAACAARKPVVAPVPAQPLCLHYPNGPCLHIIPKLETLPDPQPAEPEPDAVRLVEVHYNANAN